MDIFTQGAWSALQLAFLFGMRHGIDADHLATVDALTRCGLSRHSPLARWAGLLFSFGHGSVVVLVAILISQLHGHWVVPAWMEATGVWISTLFLLLLGSANLRAALGAGTAVRDEHSGLTRLLTHSCPSSPVAVAAIGALFALSFDTLTQIAVLSLVGPASGGLAFPVMLGMAFMLGMMLTDGLNGLWVMQMMKSADRRALAAARIMRLAVALLSLVLGLMGLLRIFYPAALEWLDGRELAMGMGVLGMVLCSYVLARFWPASASQVPAGKS